MKISYDSNDNSSGLIVLPKINAIEKENKKVSTSQKNSDRGLNLSENDKFKSSLSFKAEQKIQHLKVFSDKSISNMIKMQELAYFDNKDISMPNQIVAQSGPTKYNNEVYGIRDEKNTYDSENIKMIKKVSSSSKSSKSDIPKVENDKFIEEMDLLKSKADTLYEEFSDLKIPNKIPYIFSHNRKPKNSLEKEVYGYITENLYLWDVNDRHFEFELPSTIFTEETYVNFIVKDPDNVEYKSNYNEDDERTLTPDQLSQIFSSGKFNVESTIPGLPYEWYITKWIIKGTSRIYKDFIDAVGISFFLIYKLKYRFIYTGNWGLSFQDSIKAIITGIYEFGSAFVGLWSFEHIQSKEAVKSLKTEFVQEFLREYPHFNVDIFLSEIKMQIKYLSIVFEEKWKKVSHELEEKLYEGRMTIDEVKNEMYKIRIQKILDFLDNIHELESDEFLTLSQANEYQSALRGINNRILANEIVQRIKEYFLAHNIVDRNFLIENKSIIEAKLEIEAGIQQEYNIRSKVLEWKKNKINNIQSEKIMSIKKSTENYIVNEMRENQIIEPITLFVKNCSFNEIYNEILQKTIEANSKKVPSKIFSVGFYYVLPNKSILVQENEQSFYKLKEGYFYELSSSYPFWRFPLYFLRFFSFSWNVGSYSYRQIFVHKFGLNSFIKDQIIESYECNSTTGEVKILSTSETLKSNLSTLCSSISKSREEFENSPDDSFFGKKCARIFNYIYNYVLKPFVAFFVFMIGYPILIFLWSILWFVCLITCYVWGMLGIIFLALFNLLIIDVDYPGKDGYGFGIIPIVFYTILCKFCFQLIATIMLLIFQPLAAFLIILFGLFRMFFRFLYDCFMFVIIYIFAKIPISDSFLAWKISGPGITRKYYNSIELSDALTVVHAQLEKYELLSYKNKIVNILEEPLKSNAYKIKKTFNYYDLSFMPNADLNESIKFYKDKLMNSIYERVSIFPRVKNVKFSNEDLTSLKISSREYIRSYVNSKQMEFLFSEYGLQSNSWAKLSEIILKNAFGDQVLESLTDLDFKVEIRRNENINFDEIKDKIVEKSNFNNIKKAAKDSNTKQIELSIIKLHEICSN